MQIAKNFAVTSPSVTRGRILGPSVSDSRSCGQELEI